MSVVRRAGAGAVVAGLVLLGGPAWAQEADPCAPGPDGEVPLMCQSAPVSDTATAGIDAGDPCPAQPVEPGDGRPADEGGAVGEPDKDEPTTEDPKPEEPSAEDPGTDEPGTEKPEPEGVAPDEPAPDEPVVGEPGGGNDDPGVICAFAAPVADSGAGGAESSGGGVQSGGGGSTAADQLPRTGPYDRLLALTAIGAGLVLVGAGATSVGRRRA